MPGGFAPVPAAEAVLGADTPVADAINSSAAAPAPFRTVRRSNVEESNHSVPPTRTAFASPREAHSSGPQCEGGVAVARGLTISFDIVSLLQGQT